MALAIIQNTEPGGGQAKNDEVLTSGKAPTAASGGKADKKKGGKKATKKGKKR